MTDGRLALRATAVLAVGAFLLHQLRYLLAYGDGYQQALGAHGHGYLAVVTPLIALLAAIAAGQLLAALARAGSTGQSGRGTWRFGRVWLAASAVLLLTFAGQELVEGALSAGHPGGLEAVLGNGGWWALPLAVGFGLLTALVIRGADALLARAAGGSRSQPGRRFGARSPRPGRIDLPSLHIIGRNLAGRAPPAASA